MTEPLFRVGGVYRQRNGVVVKVTEAWGDGACGLVYREGTTDLSQDAGGARNLSDGKYVAWANRRDDHLTLIPGELTFVDGAWVTPTLDKLEAEKEEGEDDFLIDATLVRMERAEEEANARMVARDGPAKPLVSNWLDLCQLAYEAAKTTSTAKPAIPGLTRMSAQDHRLGLGRTF